MTTIETKHENLMFGSNMDDFVAVKRWVIWCRAHAHVKCIEEVVPQGILPKNYRGILIDVKVDNRKRLSDDKFYLAHADLRANVARGNCVLELNRIEDGVITSTNYLFLVFALQKFSGEIGDVDDSHVLQSSADPYCIKSLSHTKKIVSTEKVNGEAAHISSRQLIGENYFCIGSKNVHMLVRNKDDITKYTDKRYKCAKKVAHTFFHTIMDNLNISERNKNEFICFIQCNKFTTVCELLQPKYQHIVNLSNLQHSELRFICWTTPDVVVRDLGFRNTLCAMPIDEAIQKAQRFGLTTVTYETFVFDNDEDAAMYKMEDYMTKVRQEVGHEGKVLYAMDEKNNTIGIIKYKTAWYIILRAIREKVVAFNSSVSPTTVCKQTKKLVNRISEIQTWLRLSDDYTKGWTELSMAFLGWIVNEIESNQFDIRSKFPILFEQFLNGDEQYKKLYTDLPGKYC